MKQQYLALGLMSGTSVDGVDSGLFRITLEPAVGIELVVAETYPFPTAVRREILQQIDGCAEALPRLAMLNMVLGELYADCALRLLQRAGLAPEQVAAIGCHGQTIYHLAEARDFLGQKWRGTLQIGEGSLIAQKTGIPTVTDFRPADMAAGGAGAPLVPVLDRILAQNFSGPTAWQNIGGIANVCLVHNQELVAFDTGPGNMIIDRLCEEYTGGEQRFDKDGQIGRRGRLDEQLLGLWLGHPYLQQAPPKTSGRELFGSQFFCDYAAPATEDAIHTAAVYTARSIGHSYRRWLPKMPETVIVSGGGAHNPIIMQALCADLPEANILTADEAGFSTDFKEAAALALLAVFYLLDKAGTEPAATGAGRAAIAGKLSKPLPKKE